MAVDARLHAAITAALNELQAGVDEKRLRAALAVGSASDALAACWPDDVEAIFTRHLMSRLTALIQDAEEAELRALPQQLRKDGTATDSRNASPMTLSPLVSAIAAQQIAVMLQGLAATSRDAILATIGEVLQSGAGVVDQAAWVGAVVGLNSVQGGAVLKQALSQWQAGAKERASQRPPSSLLTSIRQGVLRYALSLRRSRASAVARTEAQRAKSLGQEAAWDSARKAGWFDFLPVQQEWVAHHDSATDSAVCGPMDGQRVPIGAWFSTPQGWPIPHPPAHPNCRCIRRLVIERPEILKAEGFWLHEARDPHTGKWIASAGMPNLTWKKLQDAGQTRGLLAGFKKLYSAHYTPSELETSLQALIRSAHNNGLSHAKKMFPKGGHWLEQELAKLPPPPNAEVKVPEVAKLPAIKKIKGQWPSWDELTPAHRQAMMDESGKAFVHPDDVPGIYAKITSGATASGLGGYQQAQKQYGVKATKAIHDVISGKASKPSLLPPKPKEDAPTWKEFQAATGHLTTRDGEPLLSHAVYSILHQEWSKSGTSGWSTDSPEGVAAKVYFDQFPTPSKATPASPGPLPAKAKKPAFAQSSNVESPYAKFKEFYATLHPEAQEWSNAKWQSSYASLKGAHKAGKLKDSAVQDWFDGKPTSSAPEMPAPIAPVEPTIPGPPSMSTANHLPSSFNAILAEMVSIPGPHGSQPGQWYQDSEGHAFYAKPAKSYAHAYNEVAGLRAYAAIGLNPGVDFPHVTVLHDAQGKPYVISQKIEDLHVPTSAEWAHDATARVKARQFFGMNVLLSHYDAIGQAYDNTLLTTDSQPVLIEAGGSMAFRAQGSPKASWKPNPTLDDMLKEVQNARGLGTAQNAQLKTVYGSMTDQQVASSLQVLHDNFDIKAFENQLADLSMPELQREVALEIVKQRLALLPAVIDKLQGPKTTPAAAPAAHEEYLSTPLSAKVASLQGEEAQALIEAYADYFAVANSTAIEDLNTPSSWGNPDQPGTIGEWIANQVAEISAPPVPASSAPVLGSIPEGPYHPTVAAWPKFEDLSVLTQGALTATYTVLFPNSGPDWSVEKTLELWMAAGPKAFEEAGGAYAKMSYYIDKLVSEPGAAAGPKYAKPLATLSPSIPKVAKKADGSWPDWHELTMDQQEAMQISLHAVTTGESTHDIYDTLIKAPSPPGSGYSGYQMAQKTYGVAATKAVYDAMKGKTSTPAKSKMAGDVPGAPAPPLIGKIATAASIDFTQDIWSSLTPGQQQQLAGLVGVKFHTSLQAATDDTSLWLGGDPTFALPKAHDPDLEAWYTEALQKVGYSQTQALVGAVSEGGPPKAGEKAADWIGTGNRPAGLPENVATVGEIRAAIEGGKISGVRGWSTIWDAGSIEDMNVRVVKAKNAKGEEGYALRFKITPAAREQTIADGWKSLLFHDFEFKQEGDTLVETPGSPSLAQLGGTAATTYSRDTPWGQIRLHKSASPAVDSMVQVFVKKDQLDENRLHEIADLVHVRSGYPSESELRALAESRLLYVFAPKAAASNDADRRQKALQKIEQEWSVKPEDLEIEHGADGQIEVHLPAAVADNISKTYGVTAFRHHASAKQLADIFASPAQSFRSTVNRFSEGVGVHGMSSGNDLASGGADYVFLRQGNYFEDSMSAAGMTGGTSIIFDAQRILRRTDWFAYTNDSYGTTTASKYHSRTLKALEARGGNQETMVKHQVSLADVEYVVVGQPEKLIQQLQDRGMTKWVDGRPLNEIIVSPKAQLVPRGQPKPIEAALPKPFEVLSDPSDSTKPITNSVYVPGGQYPAKMKSWSGEWVPAKEAGSTNEYAMVQWKWVPNTWDPDLHHWATSSGASVSVQAAKEGSDYSMFAYTDGENDAPTPYNPAMGVWKLIGKKTLGWKWGYFPIAPK